MVMVSEEAVEKAARAEWEFVNPHYPWSDLSEGAREEMRRAPRAALVAALPVIERELREQIAQEIEDFCGVVTSDPVKYVAARVREGGRA